MAKKQFDLTAPILRRCSVGAGVVLLLIVAGLLSIRAQESEFPGMQHNRGQDVSPMFNGWARNADGSFTMYFGYLNRNIAEDIDVPIGPDNSFDLGNGDQGQPTHFLAGTGDNRSRKMWVFQVVVPKDWPKDKRLVWTLTTNGRTNQAKGWLEPEWEVVKDGIILSDYRNEAEQGDASSYKPAISITGSPAQTITLPSMATLSATATVTASGAATGVKGLRIQWVHYRGPGKVQFDPNVSPAVKGNLINSDTKVSFSMPGNYRIRALATDGQSFSTYDVDVKVTPGTSADKVR